MLVEPLELVLHDFVALARVHRCLKMVDVDDVVGVALDHWHLVIGVSPFHVLGLDLANHCHGMDFLELGELESTRREEMELEEDSHRKKSMPTSGDLSGGAVLVKKLRKTLSSRPWCGILPFVWRAWRLGSHGSVLPIDKGRWRVAQCDHPKLHFVDGELVERRRSGSW